MAETKTTTKTTTKSTAVKTSTKSTTTKTAKTTATKAVEKKAPAKTATKTTAKAEVKPVEEKVVVAEKKAQKQIRVTLVRSTIGYDKRQGRIVEALGLGKLNSSHVLPDNPCVRGMIFHVKHLVKVEELN